MAKTSYADDKQKGADTSLMVGGKPVPVKKGVATPPPEKLTPKEVLEELEDHDRRLDALEEEVFGDVTNFGDPTEPEKSEKPKK